MQGNTTWPGPTPARGCAPGQWLQARAHPGAPLTVQCGQRLVITVEDDGLGGGPGWGPCRGGCRLPPVRAVEPLDVELEVPIAVEAEGGGCWLSGGAPPPAPRPGSPGGPRPASPLPAELALEGLLVGVGQHVPPQVLLVLGGKAALAALVGPQTRVLGHVGLRAGRRQRCSGPAAPRAPDRCHGLLPLCRRWGGPRWLHREAAQSPAPAHPQVTPVKRTGSKRGL